MLRTSGNRGADKMDVLTPVRADECQPVASDDFMDRLWRTAKDELVLVVGCAASAGYTQQGDEPEQPCENLSFHFAPHLIPPSRAPRLQNQLAVSHSSASVKSHPHSHCPFLRNGAFLAVAAPSLAFRPTGRLSGTSICLPAWRTGT